MMDEIKIGSLEFAHLVLNEIGDDKARLVEYIHAESQEADNLLKWGLGLQKDMRTVTVERDEARRLAEHYLDIIARHGIAVDEEYRLPWLTD